MDKVPTNREPLGENSSDGAEDQLGPRWYQVVGSVLAAGFGVQSKKNRERDFQHGKPIIFIGAGIAFTVLFIFSVIMVVRTVLGNAA